MSKSKIHEWNLLDAITIAIDVFKAQGYLKWAEDNKISNKEEVKKKLELLSDSKYWLPDYSSDIEYIFELKKELVFKKLSGTITDYEVNVLGILEKATVDVRHIGLVSSLPLMAQNIQKKEKRKQRFEHYQEHSKFLGMIGSMWKGTATVLEKTVKTSKWGQFWIVVFDNEGKNIVKWLTNKEPQCDIDDQITLSGVVKQHTQTDWYGSETILKNCRISKCTK